MTGRVTSKNSDQFMLRMPDGMRDRVRRNAAASRRSMNSEIVTYIERAMATLDESRAAARPNKPRTAEAQVG